MLERLGQQYTKLLNFLEENGLDKGINTNYAIGDIITFNDDELGFVGFTSSIQRLRFRVLFQRELLHKTPAVAIKFPVEKVSEFFKKDQVIAEFADKIEMNEIDGEMLYLADKQVFIELGIPNLAFRPVKKSFEAEVRKVLS